MRRRRDDQPSAHLPPPHHQTIAITIQEMVTLVEIFGHASSQISNLSDTPEEMVAAASGSALIPSLYARAGLTLIRGGDQIPLLVSEMGFLEAAVVNLESYQGKEVVLVAGYELLDLFTNRKANTLPPLHIHGILMFSNGSDDSPSGSATPSLI